MLVLKNNNALKHTGSINGAVVDPAKNYNNNIYAKDKSTLKQMMCEANIFYAKHLFMKSIYVWKTYNIYLHKSQHKSLAAKSVGSRKSIKFNKSTYCIKKLNFFKN